MIQHYIIFLIILIGMFLSVKTRKLTISASLTGGLLALLIYIGVGYIGIILLSAFFILGSLATSWKCNEKEKINLEESSQAERTAGQVFANAGVAAILGFLSWNFPQRESLFLLMITAAFSSAVSDTLSSELGNVYGKRFYNILTFRKDIKGLNGVVSLEGTLWGIAGSVVIALAYALNSGWSHYLFLIIAAGTIGNLSDSVLGASLERRKILNNNTVNFINTAVAAMVMLFLVLGK